MPSTNPSALSPQCRQILRHLQEKGSISNMEAQTIYRIRALPRRIADLREAGVRTVKKFRKDLTGQRYVRYYYPEHMKKTEAA